MKLKIFLSNNQRNSKKLIIHLFSTLIILFSFNYQKSNSSTNSNLVIQKRFEHTFDSLENYSKINLKRSYNDILNFKRARNLTDSIQKILNIGWECQIYQPKLGLPFLDYLDYKYSIEKDTKRIKTYELYIGKAYSIKAHLHYHLWENDSSYHYFSKSIYYRERTGDILEKIWAYNNIALYFNKVENIDSSAYYISKAINVLSEKTKNFSFSYTNEYLKSEVNNTFGKSYLLQASYREILLNCHRLGINSYHSEYLDIISKYKEIKPIFIEHNIESMMGHLNLYLELQNYFIFYEYQSDSPNKLKYYDDLFQIYSEYYINNDNYEKLRLYDFVYKLQNSKNKFVQKDAETILRNSSFYYNPIENYLFKIIDLKFGNYTANQKRKIIISELDKIDTLINHQERVYLVLHLQHIFNEELINYAPFKLYLDKVYKSVNEITKISANYKHLNQSIIDLNNYHQFLLSRVVNYKNDKLYFLIGIILFFLILISVVGSLYFKNRKLTKQSLAINKQLLENNQINKKIYGVISHDLSSPIANFELYLEILENKINSNEKSKSFEIINQLKTKSHFLNSTLESLLNYLKFEEDKFEIIYEKINLNSIINEIKEMQNDLIVEKNIEIITNNCENEIISEKILLSVILRNLIQNSLKFSFTNSKIIINLINLDNYITIEIIDFGLGVCEDKRKAIIRGIPITAGVDNENNQSTGFGFLLIRDIILKLNGKFEIENNHPKGTIVKVTLPQKL